MKGSNAKLKSEDMGTLFSILHKMSPQFATLDTESKDLSFNVYYIAFNNSRVRGLPLKTAFRNAL